MRQVPWHSEEHGGGQEGAGEPWGSRSQHQIKEGSRCHARIRETLDESHYIKNMLQAVKYPLMYSLEII